MALTNPLIFIVVLFGILFLIPTWVAWFTSDTAMKVYLNIASYIALAGLLTALVYKDELSGPKA